MAAEQAGADAPSVTTPEVLMAERQLFWARFCRFVAGAVLAVAVILILLDWSLV